MKLPRTIQSSPLSMLSFVVGLPVARARVVDLRALDEAAVRDAHGAAGVARGVDLELRVEVVDLGAPKNEALRAAHHVEGVLAARVGRADAAHVQALEAPVRARDHEALEPLHLDARVGRLDDDRVGQRAVRVAGRVAQTIGAVGQGDHVAGLRGLDGRAQLGGVLHRDIARLGVGGKQQNHQSEGPAHDDPVAASVPAIFTDEPDVCRPGSPPPVLPGGHREPVL
jgi:hypothetical protein